jgi:hypothetical protein
LVSKDSVLSINNLQFEGFGVSKKVLSFKGAWDGKHTLQPLQKFSQIFAFCLSTKLCVFTIPSAFKTKHFFANTKILNQLLSA